jgi:tetratricopeptide (TPR) repeat protein
VSAIVFSWTCRKPVSYCWDTFIGLNSFAASGLPMTCKHFIATGVLVFLLSLPLYYLGGAGWLSPKSAAYYNNRGVAYANKKDYDQAIAKYNEAIRLDPKLAQFYYNRGVAYFHKQEYDKAVNDFSEAIRLDPKDINAYNYRGNVYVDKKHYDQAIADFSEAIRLDPKDASAYFNRGLAYNGKSNYDQAIAAYNEAIRLDPKFAFAYINRGVAYIGKRNYAQAIADNNEALRLDPKLVAAYINRGNAYARMDDYDQAIVNYDEAIRLDPNSADANIGLAWLRSNCPKAEYRSGKKAVEYARKACELTEWKVPTHIEMLAFSYAMNGQFNEAVKWQHKALEDSEYEKTAGVEARQRLKEYEQGKPYKNPEP